MNRKILLLALPNILSNISIPLLGIVDTALMGHLQNYSFLAGIALGNLVFNFMFWSLGFLRMGTVGFTSQAFGAKNKNAQFIILYQALSIALFFSILILALQIPILEGAFKLVSSSEAVKASALQYFTIKVWSTPAILGILVFSGWFIGMQNSIYPMTIAIFTNVLNIVLSSILVLKFDMAVQGAAIGSVIAQGFGFILALLLFIKNYGFFRIGIRLIEILKFNQLKSFLSVNLDIFIRTLCIILVLSYFTIGSANTSDLMLATNTILFHFFIFFSYFLDGFANAAESLVGESFGSHNKSNLLKVIRLLFLWGLGIAILFTGIYLLFDSQIVELLTNQKEVIFQAKKLFHFIYLIPLLSFSAFIWDGIYIGATASKAMRNAMILAGLFFFASILIPSKDALNTIWISFLLFTVLRSVFLGLMFKKSILHKLSNTI